MLHTKQHQTSSRRGIFLIDALFAMAIIVLLAGLLTVALSRQRHASAAMGDTRDAVRLAEHVLTALQAHQPAPAAPDGANIDVRPLQPAPDGNGINWLSVSVRLHGRSATLIGAVPASAATTESSAPSTTSSTREANP